MFLVFGANGIVGVRKPALCGGILVNGVGYVAASRALSRFELLRLR
jgi:hypothetical protein